ncbi:MAG TPA: hypothetical protein DD979_13495 [Gammaproteobacteria bacterium]|jgi:hypothetical protein|nr:hypothetical protein [Gammaproteobacteria bacterium]
MRRLFYSIVNLDQASAICENLNDYGCGNDQYFVISRDEQGIKSHQLNGSKSLEETKILSAERRMGVLSVASIILSVISVVICIDILRGSSFIVYLLVLLAFFAVIMIGLKWSGYIFDTYFGQVFDRYLNAGSVILVVDVNKSQRKEVESMLKLQPNTKFLIDCSNYRSPIPKS